MKNTENTLLPVLLGGDLNAYSMATSFARFCGVRSAVFSRERLAITDLSQYTDLHIVPRLDDCNYAVPALLEFAAKNKEKRLLLVPCADWYMEMLEYARDALVGHFSFFIPDFEVWRTVSDKSSFLKIMDNYGVTHPKTKIFDAKMDAFDKTCSDMAPPFVVKPGDSVEYWKYPFEGMKKVYFVDTLSEARKICQRIFSYGYRGTVLIQEYIGRLSTRPLASVLTTFSDNNGRVIRAVLGDVLLEERGERARGNYSAILTRRLDGICEKIINMLNAIKYTGVANLDILYHDNGGYCLELNPRQGRSFDYVRGAGVNLAMLLSGAVAGSFPEPCFSYPEVLWRSVSRGTLTKYTHERGLYLKARELERQGKVITPYDYEGDGRILRRLYVMTHLRREDMRYKRQNKEFGVCY